MAMAGNLSMIVSVRILLMAGRTFGRYDIMYINHILDWSCICYDVMAESVINTAQISLSRDLCCNVYWRSANISQIFPDNIVVHRCVFTWLPCLNWRSSNIHINSSFNFQLISSIIIIIYSFDFRWIKLH